LISATVICKNEEKNIGKCLETIKWCDEIIVVDSESTDKTVEISKKFTDKIFINKWEGFASQRIFALSKATNEWILVIDADERCTDELKEEILHIAGDSKVKQAGYRIPRKSFVLNRWVKSCGWYPGYQLRFFRKSKVRVSDRLIHEGYEVEGETGYLKSDILHYTINSVREYIEKINYYSSLRAIEKQNLKKIGLSDILFRPVIAFIQQYIFKGGFKDGVYGLMVVNFDIITNMLTYMKIWELQNRKDAQ